MNKIAALIIACVASLSFIQAQSIPDKPNPPRLVNDFANMLNPAFEQQLEQKLVEFNTSTSTQIAVVTVMSLDGTDVSDFAFKLGEKWGIGQKGKNNGVLILLKPKIGNERGQVYIATGYGVEGAVPDATANQIIDKEMIPHFKRGDYESGIESAVNVLMELTRGEYTADQYESKGKGSLFPLIILVILFVIIMVARSKGGGSKNLNSRGNDLPLWLLMGSMASGSRHSGSFGGFSSGSGGFGGFGGGSFGGGGAGGSW